MGIISLLPGVLVLSFGLFPAVEAVQLSKRLGLKGGGSCQNACDRNSYPAVCTCNVCEGNQVARSGKKKTFQSASTCTYIATGKCKRSGKRDKETCDAEARAAQLPFDPQNVYGKAPLPPVEDIQDNDEGEEDPMENPADWRRKDYREDVQDWLQPRGRDQQLYDTPMINPRLPPKVPPRNYMEPISSLQRARGDARRYDQEAGRLAETDDQAVVGDGNQQVEKQVGNQVQVVNPSSSSSPSLEEPKSRLFQEAMVLLAKQCNEVMLSQWMFTGSVAAWIWSRILSGDNLARAFAFRAPWNSAEPDLDILLGDPTTEIWGKLKNKHGPRTKNAKAPASFARLLYNLPDLQLNPTGASGVTATITSREAILNVPESSRFSGALSHIELVTANTKNIEGVHIGRMSDRVPVVFEGVKMNLLSIPALIWSKKAQMKGKDSTASDIIALESMNEAYQGFREAQKESLLARDLEEEAGL